jgi:crotonobetainyl-CoA:carnitine CoA-transferase CaiB-like acyl-CoA transferase
MSARAAAKPGLLGGIKVVEASADAGVRYCGRLFSMLGAGVVRATAVTPRGPFDLWLDEGKHAADGLAAAAEQACGTGPLLVLAGQDNAAIEAAEAACVGADTLHLNLSWFGREGPYASWRGDEAAILGLCGLAFGFGPAEGPPTLAQGRSVQMLAGATLFTVGLAALWGRLAGSAARTVDLSVFEAALCFCEHSPPGHEVSGMISVRRGLNHYGLYPAAAYPSKDGWVGVTAHTPPQWEALLGLIGRRDLLADPRFAASHLRGANAGAVDEALFDCFRGRTTDEWLQLGQGARIPLAPSPAPAELPVTPHWIERGSFGPLPGVPGLLAPGLPFSAALDGRPIPRVTPPEAPSPTKPLAGVRVIDFTMGWAGPLATRHLADLGADIVKIESEAHFDWGRGFAPVPGSDPPAHEVAPAFNLMNRNKRGVSLDLTGAEGVAKARDLVAGADVVIDNYGPGVMDRFGLGPAALRAIRPGLIVMAMGAFGATGPWSRFRAYGSTVEQSSGLPFVNGREDWPPTLQHVAYGDPVAGVFGAAITLAALHGRQHVGGGFYDLAQVECLFQLGAEAILQAQAGPIARTGSRSADVAPRCAVKAHGGNWLVLACPDTTAWQALAGVIGRADWIADPTLLSVEGRNARADEIEAAIAAWAADLPVSDAVGALQAAGVPAAPASPPHGLASDPQLVFAQTWASMERAYVGRHLMLAAPYRLNGQRPSLDTPAPLLGEHTAEVFGAKP